MCHPQPSVRERGPTHSNNSSPLNRDMRPQRGHPWTVMCSPEYRSHHHTRHRNRSIVLHHHPCHPFPDHIRQMHTDCSGPIAIRDPRYPQSLPPPLGPVWGWTRQYPGSHPPRHYPRSMPLHPLSLDDPLHPNPNHYLHPKRRPWHQHRGHHPLYQNWWWTQAGHRPQWPLHLRHWAWYQTLLALTAYHHIQILWYRNDGSSQLHPLP